MCKTHKTNHKNSAKKKSNFNIIELNSFLVIQKLTHLQQHRNPSPKYEKQKYLHNKENYKAKIML
jgi:hypothetical protein